MKQPILFIVAIILLFGCEVDKTGLPQPSNNTPLLGTWYLKNEIITGSVGGLAVPPDTITTFNTNDYYKFNSDNTVNISSSYSLYIYTHYYSFNTTANGQTIVIGATGVPAGISYAVNKLSADTLILFNTSTVTTSGITSITDATTLFTH